MRLTDTANRRWFRRARFRTAIVYMASVSILAGLTAFILYQVELHGSQSHVCPVVEGMEHMPPCTPSMSSRSLTRSSGPGSR